MNTRTARRLLESTTSRLMRVLEQSTLLDTLSNYALEPEEALEEHERYLRQLEAAYKELDYARDMMCEAIKVEKQQIELIKSI